MTTYQFEIVLIAVIVSAACALPGVFLLLRRMSMMSDAITHTVLLGIVAGFFISEQLDSPLLIFGAAIVGVLTVYLVEKLAATRLVAEDAAIGLVFPLLFSIAVIAIARYAGDVHLDVDAVLLGELAFAPQRRLVFAGYDWGPTSAWSMGLILALNAGFILLFFKELKVTSFDPALAAALGITPAIVHYGLMALVSVTAVGAFDAVGSILVVALMIGPPSTAYLLTNDLARLIWISVVVGVVGAVAGYALAHALDASIAGAIATCVGAIFALTLVAAPRRGLIAMAQTRRRNRFEFGRRLLLAHLLNHEGSPQQGRESDVAHIDDVLRWESAFRREIVSRAERDHLLIRAGDQLELTTEGRSAAAGGPDAP